MARSRKRQPIWGNTTAESEKQDKQRDHRRVRRAVRATLDTYPHNDSDMPDSPILDRDRIADGQWTFAKDGKRWVSAQVVSYKRFQK
mgnify:CR=1 FL=1